MHLMRSSGRRAQPQPAMAPGGMKQGQNVAGLADEAYWFFSGGLADEAYWFFSGGLADEAYSFFPVV